MNTNPSKSVQFAGRTLVIQPKAKTFRTALVVDSVRAALLETIKDRQITGIEFYYYYNIYPVLAACTEVRTDCPSQPPMRPWITPTKKGPGNGMRRRWK